MSNRNGFGEILHKKRKELDMSQKEMADTLGITPPHLSQLEYGTIPVNDNMLRKVFKNFEWTSTDTFDLTNEAWLTRNSIESDSSRRTSWENSVWLLINEIWDNRGDITPESLADIKDRL